jgi:hypothetical protein
VAILATLEKISVWKTSIDVMKNGLSSLVLRIAGARSRGQVQARFAARITVR